MINYGLASEQLLEQYHTFFIHLQNIQKLLTEIHLFDTRQDLQLFYSTKG